MISRFKKILIFIAGFFVVGVLVFLSDFSPRKNNNKTSSEEKNARIVEVEPTNSSFLPKNNTMATNVFTSEALGIRFQYAREDLGEKILVEEIGNTVYIHSQGTKREDGQFVRVFTKDRNETLRQTIQKTFLKGYNQIDCFVKDGVDVRGTRPEKGIAAIINYPVGDPTTDEWIKNAEKCPKGYSVTNGLSYFWTDAEDADRYVFFSIGQYFIPVGELSNSWHTTLEFFPSGSNR